MISSLLHGTSIIRREDRSVKHGSVLKDNQWIFRPFGHLLPALFVVQLHPLHNLKGFLLPHQLAVSFFTCRFHGVFRGGIQEHLLHKSVLGLLGGKLLIFRYLFCPMPQLLSFVFCYRSWRPALCKAFPCLDGVLGFMNKCFQGGPTHIVQHGNICVGVENDRIPAGAVSSHSLGVTYIFMCDW